MKSDFNKMSLGCDSFRYEVRFIPFQIRNQVKVKYCEIIEQLNAWRNVHGLYSGTEPLNQLSGLPCGCDVTTASALSHTPGVALVAGNAGIADAKTKTAQACVS